MYGANYETLLVQIEQISSPKIRVCDDITVGLWWMLNYERSIRQLYAFNIGLLLLRIFCFYQPYNLNGSNLILLGQLMIFNVKKYPLIGNRIAHHDCHSMSKSSVLVYLSKCTSKCIFLNHRKTQFVLLITVCQIHYLIDFVSVWHLMHFLLFNL